MKKLGLLAVVTAAVCAAWALRARRVRRDAAVWANVTDTV